MPDWISVNDSVPSNSDRVVICCMGDINDYCYPYCYTEACEVGFYEKGAWYSDTMFEIIEASDKFGQRKLIDGDTRWHADVTHWMPLPSTPKDAEEERS